MMSRFFLYFALLILLSCNKKQTSVIEETKFKSDFILAFGSCNNQNLPNTLWKEILNNKPDIFVWGGDIVYSDTEDMQLMKKNYEQLKNDASYQDFIQKVAVIGTWDDHDYGLNDGGYEYQKKDSVQEIFLDFFDVDSLDSRRFQKGIYHSKIIKSKKNAVKIIVLDTRFFRTGLTIDSTGTKRYVPNTYGEGTVLGEIQWKWLENELYQSKADFNIIVSSIQFLSCEHGFETWGNMPHEVHKMKEIIVNSKAKGVIFLSGDRHIAEISKDNLPDMSYPIIDITSSGLTHAYSSFKGEPNTYRIGNVISEKNFGILRFDFDLNTIQMEIRGENNALITSCKQKY